MQMALSRALTHSGAVGDFKQALLLPELLWLTACTGFETFGHSSPLRPLRVTSAFGNAAWAGLRTQTWACESESEPSVGRASVFRYLHTGAFRLGSAAQGSVLRTRQWAGRRCAERTASSDVPVWTCKLPSSFFFFLREKAVSPHPFSGLGSLGGWALASEWGGAAVSFLPGKCTLVPVWEKKKKKKAPKWLFGQVCSADEVGLRFEGQTPRGTASLPALSSSRCKATSATARGEACGERRQTGTSPCLHFYLSILKWAVRHLRAASHATPPSSCSMSEPRCALMAPLPMAAPWRTDLSSGAPSPAQQGWGSGPASPAWTSLANLKPARVYIFSGCPHPGAVRRGSVP